MIYLDNAATTPVSDEVIQAMIPYFNNKWYNPSSLYSKAKDVKRDISIARKTIADFINAESDEIYFTSGGSESNCLAIQGWLKYVQSLNLRPCIITTVIEHKSISECVKDLHKSGIEVLYLPVNEYGYVNPSNLEKALKSTLLKFDSVLVSVQYANNEIGTIQNIKLLADIAHKYIATFHTDAIQAFGKINIDVSELGVDMMSVSGHKIHAPKGIGFLYVNENTKIKPLIYGNQENGLRGGTENVPYIIGFAEAVKLFSSKKYDWIHMLNVKEYLISRLKEEFDCKINSNENYNSLNIVNATFPQNITGEALIQLLDISDIMVSSGSACNSYTNVPSPVLKAIGLSDDEINRTIRISLSDIASLYDIDKFTSELKKCINLITEDSEVNLIE
ncbi:MAG: cysteine desulfurase [Lachnospiraceae bacterium]|nr:cysteine desulfurase [Lachnospiraceae bacterium]